MGGNDWRRNNRERACRHLVEKNALRKKRERNHFFCVHGSRSWRLIVRWENALYTPTMCHKRKKYSAREAAPPDTCDSCDARSRLCRGEGGIYRCRAREGLLSSARQHTSLCEGRPVHKTGAVSGEGVLRSGEERERRVRRSLVLLTKLQLTEGALSFDWLPRSSDLTQGKGREKSGHRARKAEGWSCRDGAVKQNAYYADSSLHHSVLVQGAQLSFTSYTSRKDREKRG